MYSFSRIERDRARFKKLVTRAIKSGIKKYISHGELIGRKGKDLVSIPLPEISIPQFRYGKSQQGVGQGEGNIGDPVALDPNDQGIEKAGSGPGEHILEVEISLEELAKIIGEELSLPKIEPRGKKNITNNKDKYKSISRTGPEALRHFKRTFRQALRRQIISGIYDPHNPKIYPYKEDKLYRSWKSVPEQVSNAVIIYMMDVSGSMGDEEKELVRLVSFWIDTWLKSQYQGIERRFIVHDAEAHEVDYETFFHTRESGGTKISSAYDLCLKMINKSFSPQDYNIYPFHFTDGDNFEDDDEDALNFLQKLIPLSNVFCYGQVSTNTYSSGAFLNRITARAARDDNEEFFGEDWENKIRAAIFRDKEDIYDVLKTFLGTGR